MIHPNKKRLRRSMMFLNAQKPGLIKDPYIYGADSIMLDLEDAVAENQKDAARYSLYHALQEIDYRGTEPGCKNQRTGYPSLEGGYPGMRSRRSGRDPDCQDGDSPGRAYR